MKKILAILFAFLGVGLLGCLIIGFCKKIDVYLLSSAVNKYKLCTGLSLFMRLLPALILSGFAVSCSIQFGRNPSGSHYRFSKAMAARYRTVLIVSLICTFILTLSTEVFSLTLKRKLENYVNQPKIVNDYIKVGKNFLAQNKPEAAAVYAKEALALDPSNKEATELKNQADIQISLNETPISHIIREAEIDPIAAKIEDNSINEEKLSEVYKLYQQAEEEFKNEDWFKAHYYAETALKIASEKDINIPRLKEISADAWNNITEQHDLTKNDEQNLFNQKYEGYKKMMNNDFLSAYHTLQSIQINHPELSKDSDLNFYLEIAENRVKERNFFVDETFELKSFESANDVYFSLKYDDGWTDIVYFKGMTQVKTSGGVIQYLRDFEIKSLNENGKFASSMKVPYAKVFRVSTADMNPLVKDNLGIPREIEYVPYILLRSIDRYNENAETRPVYAYADSDRTDGPDYLLLRMSFADFQFVETASVNPELVPVSTLFNILKKAKQFGYSSEVYGQVLLHRILYPMFILIAFILLASLAWNNRLGAEQFFKTSWIPVLPIFAWICFVLYQVAEFAFKLLIFALLERMSPFAALLWGFGALVMLLFLVSLMFLARKSAE